MTEGLGDFFKLIAEDKKKKKDEFRKLVGEIDIDSIFTEVKEEIAKDKVNSVKVEKQAKAFESWLMSETHEEKEEIEKEVAEVFKEEVEKVELELEPEPEEVETEEETLIEQSLGLLSEPSDEKMGDDPLTPLNQKFATLDDLQKHYNVFLNRIQQQLSTIGGGGENNNDGFEYVSDKSHEAVPVPLPADTWTKVSNDGASSSTKRQHLPEGVTRIYDVTNDVIKLDQLPNNGWAIFRFGVKVIPNVDNVTLKTRISWTTGSGFTFYLTSPGALLNDGAGIEYEEQFTLTFYVGDDDTKQGSGILEARADGTCTITDCAFMTIVG